MLYKLFIIIMIIPCFASAQKTDSLNKSYSKEPSKVKPVAFAANNSNSNNLKQVYINAVPSTLPMTMLPTITYANQNISDSTKKIDSLNNNNIHLIYSKDKMPGQPKQISPKPANVPYLTIVNDKKTDPSPATKKD